MSNVINPCIWLDGQAKAVADFYTSTFPDAKLLGSWKPIVQVQVGDLRLSLLNGGPQFKVNPSISFFYNCESVTVIDSLWKVLTRGGNVLMPLDAYPFARKYGWVADKFGVMDSAQPHQFTFTEGVSLILTCENQAEIDWFWSRLSEGGSEGQCGWLKDRFGVSWQVVPRILETLMADPARSKRVVEAFLKMRKFDIEKLMRA